MEKNKIRVRISDVDYTLVSTEPPEYIHKVAYMVDKKMTEIIKANSRLSSSMAAVLTSVNLADEQLKSTAAADNLREQAAKYSSLCEKYKKECQRLEKELAELKKEQKRLLEKEEAEDLKEDAPTNFDEEKEIQKEQDTNDDGE